MQRLFLIFLLLYCTSSIHPQAMNSGSAKTLEGNIYILTCFSTSSIGGISADPFFPGPLDYKEKIMWLSFKDEALKWLKEQALKYNIIINFIEDIHGLDTDVLSTPDIEYILYRIGYNKESINDYVKYVKNNLKCDNFLILLITSTRYKIIKKREIIGIAHTQHNAADTSFYLEGAVIYGDAANSGQLSTIIKNKDGTYFVYYAKGAYSTIAHEILHCFGAWDLYESENKTTGAELARKRYPRSIMTSEWKTTNDPPEVDPLTAWRIGWNKNPEPWFYECDPHKEK
jgi:hypothetical protein